MKKLIFTLMFSIILFCAFAVNVSAEETALNAPVVQFKLINHDKIALKWDAVDGADGYIIYRTDVKTGKTYKYTSPVSDTKVTVAKLSPETEYVFSVVPIKKNGDDVTIGEKSSGTRLTTPKEWYCYGEYAIDTENEKIDSHYYRENYAKTIKEEINLGDIKSADEIIFYEDQYYVIGDYDAITADKNYPWVYVMSNGKHKCIAKISENGNKKVILCDYYELGEYKSRYQVTKDAIYLQMTYKGTYSYDTKTRITQYYYFPDDCYLKKIDLKSGNVITLLSPCLYRSFFYYDGNIYYEYDDGLVYNETEDIYLTGLYKDHNYIGEDYSIYYSKMKENGDNNITLCKRSYEKSKSFHHSCFNDEVIVLYSSNAIYVKSLNNSISKIVYNKSNMFISDIKIINNYIYFTEYTDNQHKSISKYCRIKVDGSDLSKQDIPFEWYY